MRMCVDVWMCVDVCVNVYVHVVVMAALLLDYDRPVRPVQKASLEERGRGDTAEQLRHTMESPPAQ